MHSQCGHAALSQDRSPSCAPDEILFHNFASEPYVTVFADPPASFSRAASFSEVGQTPTGAHHDQHLMIHNLDTGEVSRLDENASPCSFHKEALVNPQQLESDGKQAPWVSWWAEKRIKDERLWFAAEGGSLELLRNILEAPTDGSPPAEVNSRSLYGRTALHLATSVGKPDCIELLLDAGAELEACTHAGLTALHIASQRGHSSVVSLLLDWGAEACCEAKDGNLPIHLAAANGHADIVAVLLERGSGVYEQMLNRNRLGQRAAEASLDISTAEVFRQFGAKLAAMENTPSGERSPTLDHYAGRTPYNPGTLLLHNARSDVVGRLLRKTQQSPDHSPKYGTPRTSDGSPIEGCFRRQAAKKKHAPFARVRADGPGIDKVGPDSFVLVERLGRGSFGEVFQVKHKSTKQVYAMKVLRKSRIMQGNLLRYASTERNVLSYIHHPYIVSLHFAFQTSAYLVLVLQFCPGGNLQHLIDREKIIPSPLAQCYTAAVLLALIYLHARTIVFRDLKPDNIVIDEDGHAVLTDFGLSKEGVTQLQGTKSFCGSVAFLAPEILRRCVHGHTVDVYGLGVLVFDMHTGMPPFYSTDRATLCNNIEHAPLKIPNQVPKSARSFIVALMHREPSQRLGAAQTSDIKGHEYFNGVDFEAFMRREVPSPLMRSQHCAASEPSSWMLDRPPNPFAAANPFETGRRGSSRGVSGWSFATSRPAPS
jgi:protein-serine/threonine kinase